MTEEKSFIVNFTKSQQAAILGLAEIFRFDFIPTAAFSKMKMGRIMRGGPQESFYKKRIITFYDVGENTNVAMLVVSNFPPEYNPYADVDKDLKWYPQKAIVEIKGCFYEAKRRKAPTLQWWVYAVDKSKTDPLLYEALC